MFENRKKFPLYIQPETLNKVERIYKDNNCRSKSEFIEKAIEFYCGYLTSDNENGYLPSVMTSKLKSIIAESDNKQNRMLFKLAAEITIMQNLVASSQEVDPVSLDWLCGECVKEVKRLNGSFSFENALDWQRG